MIFRNRNFKILRFRRNILQVQRLMVPCFFHLALKIFYSIPEIRVLSFLHLSHFQPCPARQQSFCSAQRESLAFPQAPSQLFFLHSCLSQRTTMRPTTSLSLVSTFIFLLLPSEQIFKILGVSKEKNLPMVPTVPMKALPMGFTTPCL